MDLVNRYRRCQTNFQCRVEMFPPAWGYRSRSRLRRACVYHSLSFREREGFFPLVTRDLERKSDKRKNRPQVASSQPPYSHLTSFFFFLYLLVLRKKRTNHPTAQLWNLLLLHSPKENLHQALLSLSFQFWIPMHRIQNQKVLSTESGEVHFKILKCPMTSHILIIDNLSEIIREPMAEFAGVAIFVMIGAGADCSVVLSTDPAVASSPKGVSRVSLEGVIYIFIYFILRIFSL